MRTSDDRRRPLWPPAPRSSARWRVLTRPAPEPLRCAGDPRLRFRDASLDELGHHAEPPMTKDAVAGRIRRLLAMADKRAVDLGVPGTDANLPPDYDDA